MGVSSASPISVKLEKSSSAKSATPLTAPLLHPEPASTDEKLPEKPRLDAIADTKPTDEKPADEKPSDENPPQDAPPEVAQAQKNADMSALSRMWGRTAIMNIRMRQIRLFADAARMNLAAQFAKNIAKQERDRIAGQECSVKLADETEAVVACRNPELSALIIKAIDWRLLPKAGDFGFSRLDMEIIIAISAEEIGIGFKPNAAMLLPPAPR